MVQLDPSGRGVGNGSNKSPAQWLFLISWSAAFSTYTLQMKIVLHSHAFHISPLLLRWHITLNITACVTIFWEQQQDEYHDKQNFCCRHGESGRAEIKVFLIASVVRYVRYWRSLYRVCSPDRNSEELHWRSKLIYPLQKKIMVSQKILSCTPWPIFFVA